jgi:hypothetical protein
VAVKAATAALPASRSVNAPLYELQAKHSELSAGGTVQDEMLD